MIFPNPLLRCSLMKYTSLNQFLVDYPDAIFLFSFRDTNVHYTYYMYQNDYMLFMWVDGVGECYITNSKDILYNADVIMKNKFYFEYNKELFHGY